MIQLQKRPTVQLSYLRRSGSGQEIAQNTFLVVQEMRDQHISHTGIGRKSVHQAPKCVEPSRRRPYSNHRYLWGWFGAFWTCVRHSKYLSSATGTKNMKGSVLLILHRNPARG